jgi:UDP-glucose 4-epimerase
VLRRKRRTVAYAFRPCIVAGPSAQTFLEEIPYYRISDAMPSAVRRLLTAMPVLKPVIPDPGVRFQLVHEDDVAQAFVAGVLGRGEPGPYNLAGNGTLTMSDVADALGWYSVPVSRAAVEALAEVATRLPLMPESVAWLHSVRKEVLLKTERAKRLLRWKPKHNSRRTLEETVAARRADEPAAR